MPEPLSEQLRQEVTFYLQRGDTNKMIFDATNIPRIRIRKLRKNWVTTGSVVVHAEPTGRPKKLLPEHEKALVRFLTRKPNAYHEEAVQFLADAFDVKIHQSTISRALKKLGIVRYHQRKPVPGENEEGGAKWLPGPGPRPSTLVDVRSIDPALQNMTPSCAPHPSEIQRPLGFPTQPRTPLESDNPQPSQNLRPPENQHPPSQIPRAPELQRTPENHRNGNTTTGIANNNTQENLLPILQSDVSANAGGNT